MHPGLTVRVMEDSNCMMVLDLLSVLTDNDRKKASQTLARVSSKPETLALLTLRHPLVTQMKKNPRKLISFANAIQLLLILPKRTVDLQTRRTVAGILADYFEAPVDRCIRPVVAPDVPIYDKDTLESLAIKRTHLQLEEQTIDIEHKRKRQPLETIGQCLELLQKCGPLSEGDVQVFRRAVAGHMAIT
jgi:hypothetical protein